MLRLRTGQAGVHEARNGKNYTRSRTVFGMERARAKAETNTSNGENVII